MNARLSAQSEAAWQDALWQLMPRGWAWNRDPKSNQSLLLLALAKAVADVDSDCDAIALESLPNNAFLLLDEYETYLGLPECYIDDRNTIAARRNAIVTKDKLSGGLACWQVEQLAGGLGFDVAVTEQFPHHCLRNCMYPLWSTSTRHTLLITVNGVVDARMTCVDNVLTPLINSDVRVLECILGKYKMAGKYYIYSYPTENESGGA